MVRKLLGRLAVLIVATFVGCMAAMFAVTGGGADVVFGLVIAAGTVLGVVGIFRSKSWVKRGIGVAVLVLLLLVVLATAAPSCRRVDRARYERIAHKYRGGKGYAGAYAHLIDKTNGKAFYVVVQNLNRRQNVGELAEPDVLRFDSLYMLDMFVKTQLGAYELYSVWDVDPDPTGRYALVSEEAVSRAVKRLSLEGKRYEKCNVNDVFADIMHRANAKLEAQSLLPVGLSLRDAKAEPTQLTIDVPSLTILETFDHVANKIGLHAKYENGRIWLRVRGEVHE